MSKPIALCKMQDFMHQKFFDSMFSLESDKMTAGDVVFVVIVNVVVLALLVIGHIISSCGH